MHFSTINKLSDKLPYGLAQTLVNEQVIPLVYHAIGYPEKMPYLKGLYTIFTPEQFEADLDFLLKHFIPIGLEELVRYKSGSVLSGEKKYFFLSFDDGLRQCSEIIAPILEKKGVPATFFINTGFVDNKRFLHRFKVVLLASAIKADKSDVLKNAVESYTGTRFSCRYKAADFIMTLRFPQVEEIDKIAEILTIDIDKKLAEFHPYMTFEEISGLIFKGFTIGAHSVDHPEFYLFDEDFQVEQACKSISQVKEWFNPKYSVFAFPFTDVGVKSTFFEKLAKQCKPDLTFACSGLKKDLIVTNVHRIPMDDIGLRAEKRLKSEFLYYFLKWPLGKNTFRRL